MQRVIDNLKKVLPMATMEKSLNMNQTRVNNHGHICGTVHCLGGWYAVGVCNLSEEIGYREGARKMSQDLGFEDDDSLEEWCEANPDIWGNKNGYGIFSDEHAFTSPSRPHGAFTLQHIIDHLEEVRDRL